MGKIAFVFAGQGAQYSGMGKDLFNHSVAAKAVFDIADRIRPNTSKLCFEGSMEELSITKNTQPAMFAVDLACAKALAENGIKPDGAAGFSLGEIAALAFCSVLSYEEAFSLVCKRGLFMQACAEANKGAMAAVLKLDNEKVLELCSQFKAMFPVNYNCKGQVVVAGAEDEMDQFTALVSQNGGRAMKLAVSGAFHSPFMEDASERLMEELKEYEARQPSIPLYANVTAMPYGGDIKELISKQVKSPVLWQTTIENMIKDGFTTFIEVGAGKTLSGLIKKISQEVAIYNVENNESLQSTLEALTGGNHA